MSRYLPEPMMLVRWDGTVLAANLAASEVLGSSSERLAGRSLGELCAAEGQSALEHVRRCARTSGPLPGALWIRKGAEPVRHRSEGVRASGTEGLVILRFWDPGEQNRFVLLGQRIQQFQEQVRKRRAAQEQGRRALERLGRLQSVTAALCEAVGSPQVISVMSSLGREATEADGIFLCRVVPGTDEIEPLGQGIPRTGPPGIAEAIRSSEWVVFPSAAEASRVCIPMVARGRVLGAVGLHFARPRPVRAEDRAFWDALVSQFLQALERSYLFEAERDARAEAERANQTKDAFLSTVSHELRTPLTAILGWARMLASGAVSPAKVPRAIQAIERNAVAQARLVEDLLEVSRIASGKLRLEVGPVDVGATLREVLDSAKPAAEAKAIALETRVDPLVGAIPGDGHRIQQILSNLLSNALEYTPSGGRVTLRADRRDQRVEIEVRDTGEGIPPELLLRIFDRFRQADSRTTRRHQGLGLGLAIARHLAELHGGALRAESAGPGQGSTFRLELPAPSLEDSARDRSAGAREAERISRSGAADLRGIHVLVVEDAVDTLEMLRFALEEVGARVTGVGSVEEAFEALEAERPDLMVSDIGLPGSDGLTLMRTLRARGETLPAIALTAYVGVQSKQMILESGFDRHLAKPADPAELARGILQLVESGPRQEEDARGDSGADGGAGPRARSDGAAPRRRGARAGMRRNGRSRNP